MALLITLSDPNPTTSHPTFTFWGIPSHLWNK